MEKRVWITLVMLVLIGAISYLTNMSTSSPTIAAVLDQNCHDCNVLFISLTNVQRNHVGAYGYERDTTPNIDAFAKKSILFTNAYSVASWTLPVAVSIYTSRLPLDHKVMTRYTSINGITQGLLGANETTLVEILRKAGYTTATFNGGQDYKPMHGITSRFDYQESVPGNPDIMSGTYSHTGDIVPKAIKWLRQNKNKKFFMHLQGYDAHCPFAYPLEDTRFDPDYDRNVKFDTCYWTFGPTEPIVVEKNGVREKYWILAGKTKTGEPVKLSERDVQHMLALYDGEIHFADKNVGVLLNELESLKLMDNTIIVFFSEHGDMFGKHGRFMRGGPLRGTFYDDVLTVPLIMYNPRLPPRKVKSMVSLIDIAPTLLDWLGLSIPASFEGENLLESRRDKFMTASLYVPSSTNAFFNRISLVSAIWQPPWKLIYEAVLTNYTTNTFYELYNLEESDERVQSTNTEKLNFLNNTLQKWLSQKYHMAEAQLPVWAAQASSSFS